MFIERLIINGFKSYRDHTIIDGFDPCFNAITGPNGSGKSNILDAICFVLGISNLSHVRANSLQELIYKQGQSGVTKAIVEIIFNNSDKSQSPVGYENFDHIKVSRQITSGSTSKYFINDHPANQQRVQTLFHSVQLNINNPHFLIMQGRITKVLNMRPPEILGLIEEAAGIRMFEDKKDESKRVLERKQRQLDEIDNILETDLIPNLEKLRIEKEEYNRWVSSKNEFERLNRWLIGLKFNSSEERLENLINEHSKVKEELKSFKKREKGINEELNKVRKSIKDLNNRKESNDRQRFQQLESEFERNQDLILRKTIEKEQLEDEIRRHGHKKESINLQMKSDENQCNDKKNDYEREERELSDYNEEVRIIKTEVSNIEKRISDVNIGIINENENCSLSDQIEQTKRKISDYDLNILRITNSRPHLNNQHETLIHQKRSTESELRSLEHRRNQILQDIEIIENDINRIDFDPEKEKSMIQRRDYLNNHKNSIEDEIDQLERNLVGIEIDYHAPPGFSHEKVRGVLARLIRIKDNRYTVAAETVAGAKLYYIVVDDVETSKSLLRPGVLSRRSTVIPLDEIRSKEVSSRIISTARKISPGACVALDYIECEDYILPAAKFAFGQSIVCDTLEEAKNVTFHPEVRTKTVTLEGDVFDPQGTLSGGSRPNNSGILDKISHYQDLKNEEKDIIEEINTINNSLADNISISRRYSDLSQKLDISRHELEISENALSRSRYHEIDHDIGLLEEEIHNNESLFIQMNNQKNQEYKNLEHLQQSFQEWTKLKNSRINELETYLKDHRGKLDLALNRMRKKKDNVDLLSIEIQDLSMLISNHQSTLKELEHRILEQTSRVKEVISTIEECKLQKISIEKELQEVKEIIQATDESLSACILQEEELQKELTSTCSLIRQKENYHNDLICKEDSLKQKINDLKKNHPWIEQERRFFGVSHTEFDFSLYDKNETKSKTQELKTLCEELGSHINKRAMSMFEKAETELNMLRNKKEIVENEKQKIIDVINELEIKKKEAISSTHRKVNEDLGNIVSEVLPGSRAGLSATEGKTIFDGLEIIVSFSGVNKSLQELSGGQRSLIALSLVLSLLKFKPAPVYILDEIDAALDLSHTQNIGKMLRKSFKNAQFIVVSLKEGMWHNANVLFKTSFRDSNSEVERIQNRND